MDLNAPSVFLRTQSGQVRPSAVADLTRPITPAPNGFRRVTAMVDEGTAHYHGPQVNVNKHFSHAFSLLASYTYSHTINDAGMDAPGGDPNNSNLRLFNLFFLTSNSFPAHKFRSARSQTELCCPALHLIRRSL